MCPGAPVDGEGRVALCQSSGRNLVAEPAAGAACACIRGSVCTGAGPEGDRARGLGEDPGQVQAAFAAGAVAYVVKTAAFRRCSAWLSASRSLPRCSCPGCACTGRRTARSRRNRIRAARYSRTGARDLRLVADGRTNNQLRPMLGDGADGEVPLVQHLPEADVSQSNQGRAARPRCTVARPATGRADGRRLTAGGASRISGSSGGGGVWMRTPRARGSPARSAAERGRGGTRKLPASWASTVSSSSSGPARSARAVSASVTIAGS